MAGWRLAGGWLAAGLQLAGRWLAAGWLIDFLNFFTLTEVSKDLYISINFSNKAAGWLAADWWLTGGWLAGGWRLTEGWLAGLLAGWFKAGWLSGW